MDQGIRDADRVLMVCTANYVAKAEERKGGAGYEGMIVTGHVARATDTIKFVPIVRGNSGEPLVPGFLGLLLWLDFRDDGVFEQRLEELLRDLHGAPCHRKPPLGRNPFAGSELEGAANGQESPSPSPGPSRGGRVAAGRRQEAGDPQGAKGPAASSPAGSSVYAPAPPAAPASAPAATPAAPAPQVTPAGGAIPASPSSSAASPPSLALRPITVTTARLRGEAGRWQVERQEALVQACAVELGEGERLRLIQIPAGEFLMGSSANEPMRRENEGPQHRVRLASFLMGQTPVTQAQWRVVAGWPCWILISSSIPQHLKGSKEPIGRWKM